MGIIYSFLAYTSTHDHHQQQRSSNSSMDTNDDERLDNLNEFEQTKHRWEEK